MKKIYLFAAIFALLAGVATYFFATGVKKDAYVAGVEEANVVIALQDIEPDTVVAPEMFTVSKMPLSAVTPGTLANLDGIDGYVAAEKITKGEQVLAAKLIRIGEKTNLAEANGEYRLSYHIDKDHYAYSFKADDVDGVAYFVRKGDFISIYQYDTENPDEMKNPVVENVKVLEVGTYSDKKLITENTETADYAIITVSLTKEQIEAFIEIDEPHTFDDKFHVVLVPYAEGAGIDVKEGASDISDADVITPETNHPPEEIASDGQTEARGE